MGQAENCVKKSVADRWGSVCVAIRLFWPVRVNGRECDPGVIVNRHEQHLPASTLHAVATVAGDAVAGAHDAA